MNQEMNQDIERLRLEVQLNKMTLNSLYKTQPDSWGQIDNIYLKNMRINRRVRRMKRIDLFLVR